MTDYGILGTPENADRMARTLTQELWEVFYKRGVQTFLFGDCQSWQNTKLGVQFFFEDNPDLDECDIYLNRSKHSTAHRTDTGIQYRGVQGGYRTPG